MRTGWQEPKVKSWKDLHEWIKPNEDQEAGIPALVPLYGPVGWPKVRMRRRGVWRSWQRATTFHRRSLGDNCNRKRWYAILPDNARLYMKLESAWNVG